METAHRSPLIRAACCMAALHSGWILASGGWFDVEPPHSLQGDLDRLPAKSLGQIILETEPEAKDNAEAKFPELADIILEIDKQSPAKLAAMIDKLVAQNRRDYTEGGGLLNTLYDIRDAITAEGPSAADKKAYCTERQDKQPQITEGAEVPTFAKGDPMRPHRLYLQGAALFTGGDRVDCRPWFEEIVSKYPNHPRSETARFLIARCALSATRSESPRSDEDKAKELQTALSAFRDYLKRYPKGRYVADAHGWLGALLWHEKPADALEHYIAQLEDPEHPECRKSAAHMVENVLATVVGHPEEPENVKVLAVLAKHPRIAQAAVYFVLNAPETDPRDGKYDEVSELKAWRLTVLPMLAKAVAAEGQRYKGEWSLRMRAMLAQAASAAGKQDEALKLTDSPKDLKASDDLSFARLVALQRARKTIDAVKAGQSFLETFPESPLVRGATIRTANALIDAHRSGEAYVVLMGLQGEPLDRTNGGSLYPESEGGLGLEQSGVYPDIQGDDATRDLMTTIANFAPLPELEPALTDAAWKEKADELTKFKELLALRKAGLEDFAGASAMSADEELKKSWAGLQQLALEVEKAGNSDKAVKMVALGDAFESAAPERARPRDWYDEPSSSDSLTLRENAKALGFPDPDKELENRSYLRHATRWWLRAARTSPKTSLSAKARFKVLETMERVALATEYDFVRATEINGGKVSRDIYDILQKENPGSDEAKKAVYWSFVPAFEAKPKDKDQADNGSAELQRAMEVYYRGESDNEHEVDKAVLLGGYKAMHYNAFGEFPELWQQDEVDNEKLTPVREVIETAAKQLYDWEKYLSAQRVGTLLPQARAAAENATQMSVVNLLEDLSLFHGVTGLPEKARLAYVRLRLRIDNFPFHPAWTTDKDTRPSVKELIANARNIPELAAVADFIDYAELYANEADRGPDGKFEPVYPDYKSVEAGCRAFLQKYPKSTRREACQLLLMRAIYRQLPERYGHVTVKKGEQESTVIKESEDRFRADKLVQAMTDYEKEFRSPHYAAELRNFRGIIAWRTFDYDTALKLTLAQLGDMQHPDLRREGAVRLANIFADLRDPRHRVALMDALKKQPPALDQLKAWLAIAPLHQDHPLRCMGQYLKDQMGL